MQQLPGEAVARLLTTAVECDVAAVGQRLREVPAAEKVPQALVLKLLNAAVEQGWVEPACSLCSLLQKILRNW
jgi:hypothetical protein